MGKFIDNFKKLTGKVGDKATEFVNKKKGKKFRGGKIQEPPVPSLPHDMYEGVGEDGEGEGEPKDGDGYEGENYNPYYDDVGIQPAQKPESFHHFILENQYKDLERSIRGYKEVFDKETNTWTTKRKSEHCFTDEEAEEILRTAQSHLATDIKLSFINKDVIGIMMMAIYVALDDLFYAISEYRYGRYSATEKNPTDRQYKMKLQNRKIFLELWTRIQANYSRAIQGQENKYTHDSVKGQESLQQSGRDEDYGRRYS
jgi:hypothetical protein